MTTAEMVAGRELDAVVAEKVMGLKPCSDPVGRCEAAHMTPCQCWGDGGGGSDLCGYSKWIDYAWQVVERMNRQMPNEFQMMAEHGGYTAEFAEGKSHWAETAPLAICRAALAALEVE